jgi:hypothetical protein
MSCFSKPKVCIQKKKYDADEVKTLFPILNDLVTLRDYMTTVNKQQIKEKLIEQGYIKYKSNRLSDSGPFNVFARIASKSMVNKIDQTFVRDKNDWILVHNLSTHDDNWNNTKHPGGSMAGRDEQGPGHVFLTTKKLGWEYFNITTIMLHPKGLRFLKKLRENAVHYSQKRGWDNPGFILHCYPYNSVNSFHLHIVNMDNLGHNYYKNNYKNLLLDDVITYVYTARRIFLGI